MGLNIALASKNSNVKESFYSAIQDELKRTTNLTQIGKHLGLEKQRLNYYLRKLEVQGAVVHKGKGWWELSSLSKNSTVYGSKTFPSDTIRGHAYVWVVKMPKRTKEFEAKWEKRIEILETSEVHYKLVGAMRNIPRIKVLGRKVWLCNDHLRIYEKKDASFYGENAVEAKKKAVIELMNVLRALEGKLGIILRPCEWESVKEHYALIENALAIEHNKKGIIMRIEDETGEWALIDDSMGKGGELETIGKQAFPTNIKMQKWWNENKQTNFQVTPSFILETMNGIQQNQKQFAEQMIFLKENIDTHFKVLNKIGDAINTLAKKVDELGKLKSEL